MNDERAQTRRLVIVRHARAAGQPPAGGSDRERPLTDRGEMDARAAARRLVHAGITVQHIVSSPAIRTQGTARIMAAALRCPPEQIEYAAGVYNASLDTLLDVIAGCDPAVRGLMLVGHNPGLSDLAGVLVPEPLPGLPPGGIVAVELPIDDWSATGRSRGRLVYHDFG